MIKAQRFESDSNEVLFILFTYEMENKNKISLRKTVFFTTK